MMHRRSLITVLLTGGTLCAFAGSALADPPARVGRLSYADGGVAFRAPGDSDWNQAAVNTPVTTGDAVWTDPDAKSEVQVGGAEVRLDQSTEMAVTKLDDTSTELAVPQGVVNVHVREVPPGGIVVDTPQGIVALDQPGSYHIDSGNPSDPTDSLTGAVQVSVFEGEAQVTGPDTLEVRAGEAATFGQNIPVSLVEAMPTPFDNWALQREHRERISHTAQYVAPEVTGYQDLDNYGQWAQTPQYGAVWYPQVDPGWQPYSDGQWAYSEPWGWTWVDNSPWGFAPFHYGRWVHGGGRWGWWPGERVAQPVYAPALVAFVGGDNWNPGGGPAVGWVPLAPYEAYHPWYNRDPGYWQSVNRPFVHPGQLADIRPGYAAPSRHANINAAIVVNIGDFRGGGHIHGSDVHVAPAALASAPRGHGEIAGLTPTARPSGSGLFGAHHFEHAPTPPAAHAGGSMGGPVSGPPATHIGTPMRPGGHPPPSSGFYGAHPPSAGGPFHTPAAPNEAGGREEGRHFTPAAAPAPSAHNAIPPTVPPAPGGQHGDFAHASTPAYQRPVESRPFSQAPTPDHQAAPTAPHTFVSTPREREEFHPAPAEHAAPVAPAPQPHADIQHPMQSAPIHATSQGWSRAPQQHAAPQQHGGQQHDGGHGDDKKH